MSRHLSASVLLSALVFLSCAVRASSPPQLPDEVKMNASAGRWGLLLVTLRLEGGQELPFVFDTGSSWTLFDKSLEKKLGRRLGTETLSSWSGRTEATAYSAPKVCLGGTALVVEKALACNLKRLKSPSSARGVLGMDCLEHYCIQLDFLAGKIRFLDPERVGAAELGTPFPLAFRGKLPFIPGASLVGGAPTELLVDTGYDLDGQVEKKGATESASEVLRFPECNWAGSTYTNLVVRQAERGNVLGLRFLARHLVTFNFPKQTFYLRRTTPGPLVKDDVEAAVRFLKTLKETGQLPGWPKHRNGVVYADPYFTETLAVQNEEDLFTYHYAITRLADDEPWKLQRAWRTDKKGFPAEEFPLP